MTTCPTCGAALGRTQRTCRVCGAHLDQAQSGDGLLGRFRRWLAGSRHLLAAVPRFSLSVRVTHEGQEEGEAGAVDPESIAPEERAALGKPRLDAPGDDSVVKVTSVGPVQVTTRTTTATRTYHSLDEMPPALRQHAEAALKGGLPKSATAVTVVINGEKRTYSRVEDVPEPYRQALAEARKQAGPH